MILPCKCKNEGQDKLYGVGKRVHNRCKSKITTRFTAARCTVCLDIKEVGG